MIQASRYVLAALLLAAGATAIVPALAQFAPEPQDNAATPDAPKGKKNAPAARVGPDVNGNWAGQMTQVGREAPFKFEIALTARALETKYPDLNCTGKLTRIGQSKSYVFFVEVITQGQADKGGNCPDGTITVARSADKLAVAWFGSVKENTIVAYGTLAKK
jgi:hypothetical protein